MEYRLVRLNRPEHTSRNLAIQDMVAIVEQRGYWSQNEPPPEIPAGTPLVGMGSYGGRGLYLHGIVSGAWEATEELPYRHKLPVTWAHAIYELPSDPERVGALVEAFNPRSWSRCTQDEFAAVIGRVLTGELIELP